MLGSESAKLHPGMGGNERRTKKKTQRLKRNGKAIEKV